MSTNQDPIVVIGGGIAGVMAARRLMEAGEENVLLLEKGRNVGGRMVTREMDGARIDHGVQFFTASSPAFQSIVQQWLARGLVQELKERPNAYFGSEGMSMLVRRLAEPVDFCVRVRVTKIQQAQGHWILSWISEEQTYVSQTYEEVPEEAIYDPGKEARIRASAVILTIPVPQALFLLKQGELEWDEKALQSLRQVEYLPCLSALLVLDGESNLPSSGYITSGLPFPIRVIFDQAKKGISQVPSLTIQALEQWSRDHFWQDDAEILNQLIAAASPWIGKSKIICQDLKRWSYSLAHRTYPATFLDTGLSSTPLILAGDAFVSPADPNQAGRVETAVLSGIAAADCLLEKLKRTE